MKAAEQQLRAVEVRPGFGLLLLELLRDASIALPARQAGAIYFKNYLKRQWTVENGGMAAADKQAIKQHLLTLMLQAPKPIQVQLAAGLEEISVTDYPGQWETLLPEMVQHLKTSQDIQVLKGTMETASTVFLKFRSQSRSDALLKEIKYTVQGFQETHLTIFKAVCGRLLTSNLAPDDLYCHLELLSATVGVFHSLNVIDLPEFFEDHREEYFKGYLEVLGFATPAQSAKGDMQSLLEQVKGSICECFSLWADKYQEEFMPFLLPCVNAVFTLLLGLDQQDSHDQLVARGIHFLSSAASTSWPQSPFEDPSILSGICEKVVFPNILLRDSDVELFEDNPLEFIRRDMESADQETRRRSALDLVKAMSRTSEAKVTEILTGYVKALMVQAQSVPSDRAERFKDGCLYLCIAMAVRGQTQREGVTVLNQNVNIAEFLTSIVTPVLTSEPLSQQPLLRASSLKFLTVFRTQLPKDQVGAMLPAICKHITAPMPVVHTYAAITVEKLLSVKERMGSLPIGQAPLRYDAASLAPHLLQMIDPILQLIASGRGIPQNEYLMRALARIFSFLKQQGAEAGLAKLPALAAIVAAMADNPSNPVFNHNLFEAIASIVKVTAASRPDAVEAALLPVLGQTLERNVTDFLPYAFQILGLLLDAAPAAKPLYQDLFGRLLAPELWRSQANCPGLVRLLRAYFAKHTAFAELLRSNMQALLERFQFLLNNRKTEASAMDLLNCMYMQLPLELYQQYFRTLVTVVLTRLQAGKSPQFKKLAVVSFSVFVHKHPNNVLPQVFSEIQPQLLSQMLPGIWLPALAMSLKWDERKVCGVALARLMGCDEVRQNPQLLSTCCVAMVNLLGLVPSSEVPVEDGASDDEQPPANGGAGLEFEVSFSKLRNTDLPGASAGLAPDIPDLPAAAKALLAPLASSIAQCASLNIEVQPLARFLQ
eukprot:CAMPEP_0178390178 /NCGR_PEP_ID=MMETSP0689_2-20121128/10510_1 /TAXON_ID=160604 /ORGANISM="Amphidinium massartii, Strain CS-259" /LENGTH=939 /DNA_ID=CAMNT_0020010675 /DNA_START=68 /DNA_END=2887 /DNA_ORIENTATION=+